MANFNQLNEAELNKLLEAVNGLPLRVKAEMHLRGLEVAGGIIRQKQIFELNTRDFVDTGQLIDSIGIINEGPANVDVGPTSKRRRKYKKRTIRVKKGRYATGSAVRNAEVGFILHYGAERRGIKPSYWMEHAADAAVDEVIDAITGIYDEILLTLQEG